MRQRRRAPGQAQAAIEGWHLDGTAAAALGGDADDTVGAQPARQQIERRLPLRSYQNAFAEIAILDDCLNGVENARAEPALGDTVRRAAQVTHRQAGPRKSDLGPQMPVKAVRDPEKRAPPGPQRGIDMLKIHQCDPGVPMSRATAFQHLQEADDTLGHHFAQDRHARQLGQARPKRPSHDCGGGLPVGAEIADGKRAQNSRKRQPVALGHEPGRPALRRRSP